MLSRVSALLLLLTPLERDQHDARIADRQMRLFDRRKLSSLRWAGSASAQQCRCARSTAIETAFCAVCRLQCELVVVAIRAMTRSGLASVLADAAYSLLCGASGVYDDMTLVG